MTDAASGGVCMRNLKKVLAAGAALCLAGCGDGGSAPASATSSGLTSAEAPVAAEETSSLTGPQKNAVRSARNYLSISGFSRDGLITQLSSEYGDGYSVADATAAVDSMDIDWNENAAKSGRQYLSMTGFSCSGLVEQLSSDAGDKYTTAQAQYGAQQAGAC
ncbi:Ltp family lipoprotein [Brevundimonas sp.]|uniref:Ltp family lipoprotein n=1 Tax=Brevundimonas sp. TaxID=1871086 RepID=UPI00289959DC|nr:Ltp family lipoprotein [Brevundimonas sp.]